MQTSLPVGFPRGSKPRGVSRGPWVYFPPSVETYFLGPLRQARKPPIMKSATSFVAVRLSSLSALRGWSLRLGSYQMSDTTKRFALFMGR